MLASVMPNTAIMQPGPVQPQQTANVPPLMGQNMPLPVVSDHQAKQQNANNAQFPNASAAANNFFIPDLSKPPPGFMNPPTGGSLACPPQQIPALLQQLPFAQIKSSIPPNQSMINPPPNLGTGDILNNVPNLNVDLRNITAALQMVQQQQHLMPFDNQMMAPPATGEDDELPPPPPSMHIPIEAEMEQSPSAPYYDLPAGLMVPLIRLEDYNYKPLDPVDIRLPPPAPQSERLTNALVAFYSLPTHDRPRDKYVYHIYLEY